MLHENRTHRKLKLKNEANINQSIQVTTDCVQLCCFNNLDNVQTFEAK